jgi:hypothetical protein
MSLIDGRWKEDTRKLVHIATTSVLGTTVDAELA